MRMMTIPQLLMSATLHSPTPINVLRTVPMDLKYQYPVEPLINLQASETNQPLATWIVVSKLSSWLLPSEEQYWKCLYVWMISLILLISLLERNSTSCSSGRNCSLRCRVFKSVLSALLILRIILVGMTGRLVTNMIFKNFRESCLKYSKELYWKHLFVPSSLKPLEEWKAVSRTVLNVETNPTIIKAIST